MTFDEAVEELKTLSKNGADTWYGDNLEKRTHVKGHIESGSVEMLIYQLRKEYAPTIEMTVTEKEVMTRFICNVFSFTQFIEAINNGYDTRNMLYHEAKKDFKKRVISDGYVLNERQLMQAWLHPETIKVIGENYDTATSSRNKN